MEESGGAELSHSFRPSLHRFPQKLSRRREAMRAARPKLRFDFAGTFPDAFSEMLRQPLASSYFSEVGAIRQSGAAPVLGMLKCGSVVTVCLS